MTPQQKLQQFLAERNISKNRFFGRCIALEDGRNFIVDILSKEEGNLLLKADGDRFIISLKNYEGLFNTNEYYEFSLHIPALKDNEEINFLLIDTQRDKPLRLTKNPYSEIIRLRYERLNNPEANKMIANLMREIGKGLYSSKQRMIFELLQNADDTPIGNSVSFHIDTFEDYLLIMHNGIPFNRDDVEAITSAAESTKRNDRKKTGYKGIGFKSVFTDSEEVIIKSGGFLFKFRRYHSAYEKFEDFYFSQQRYVTYPDLLVEDKAKYTKQIRTFNGYTDIPWQLIPIWMDKMPYQLTKSNFFKYNNNVGFAIKIGAELITQYLEAISAFSNHPQFILFLRNVEFFNSIKNGISVSKKGVERVRIEKKTSEKGEIIEHFYVKRTFDDIFINDEALAEEGIEIYKKQKENDYGEISHYFSYDEEGKKVIESIPPKLASFDETTITFAARIIKNEIQAEQEYIDGNLYSSFYTYLPMKELRVQLPFLVNADFVPDSSREKLQGDNPWNEYIIAKVAKNHVKWLNEIAQNSIKEGRIETKYLSLLLKKLLPDEDSIQLLIDKYNKNYLEELKITPLIIDDEVLLRRFDEIIVDETGFSKLFGSDLLYTISGTDKFFPNSDIKNSYLKLPYINIDKFESKDYILFLSKTDNKVHFIEFINNLESDKYLKLLDWLDEFIGKVKPDNNWIMNLPIIIKNANVFTINEVLLQNQTLFRYELLVSTRPLFEKLGYSFTDIKIDDYDNLFAIITKSESYLNKPLLIYKKIEENQYLNQLTPFEKNQLLNFVKNLTGVNEVKFANTLKICSDSSQVLRPLNCLISSSCIGIPKWLDFLKITSDEENVLDDDFKSYLISQDEILSKVFCHIELFEAVKSQLNLKNHEDFYAYILKLDSLLEEDKKPNYTTTKWLYIPSVNEFSLPKQVYCPSSLRKIKSKERYEQLRSIIEKHTTLSLPVFESLLLITKLSLGCNENSIQKYLAETVNMSLDEVNIFLDWLEEEDEKDFLKNYQIYREEDLSFSIVKSSNEFHYFTNDTELINYVDESNLKNTLVLFPSEIYTQKRKELGLLEGNTLTKYIITNANILTKDFVNFIKNTKEEDGLKLSFINKLSELCLFSDAIYDRNSQEHEILQILISLGKDNDVFFDSFIPKIQIDGHSINKKNISDNVTFRFDKTETEPKKEYPPLKLSAILPNYKDETAALTMVVNNFVDVSNKRLLQEKVFKTQEKRHLEIFNEIHEVAEYLSPEQVIFLILYGKKYPMVKDIRKGKLDFDEFFYENDKSEYELSCVRMLNLVYELNFSEFTNGFHFSHAQFNNLVLSETYSHPTEKLPTWMSNWLNGIDTEKKHKFLLDCGLNDENSNKVYLRKGILDEDKDLFMRGVSNVSDITFYSRTFEWLKELQTKISLNLKKDFLLLIYEKIDNLLFKKPTDSELVRIIRLKKIYIPILNQNDTYTLAPYDEASIYHYRSAAWGEYDEMISKSILSQKQLIVDDTLPKSIRDNLKCLDQKPTEQEDIDELTDNSKSFKVPYYDNWALKGKYPVFIFNNGEIPYKVFYNQIEISTFNSGHYKNLGGVFYISQTSENEILKILRENIPNSDYGSLDHERLKHREQLEKEKDSIGKIEELTEEELEELNLLLKQPLSDDEKQNQSILAIYKALKHYENLGHDVEYCKENFEEILKKRMLLKVDENLNVYVRSAKGGMLYLRYHLWHKLDKNDIELFCITGKNADDYEIFKSKADLANYNPDSWVFKLMTENKLEDINALFEGKIAKNPELLFSNLWIFIRVKQNMGYNSSFDNIFKNEYIKHNQPDWENDLD